jgi:hypothetical protein
MKTVLSIITLATLLAFVSPIQEKSKLVGAWESKKGNEIHTIIFSEKYYALSEYDLKDKKFIATRGGSWRLNGKNIVLIEEFNTANTGNIGKEISKNLKLAGKTISVSFDDQKDKTWTQVDSGEPGKLAGAWLITGRMNEGEMQKITPGVRRTMKILSGTRFQWIAYNTETKEFFGTGGGTYKTEQGKYTENIEFFSRDNSRVGQSLQFDFSMEDGHWRHKGLSSKGDPIDELWTKREQLGI